MNSTHLAGESGTTACGLSITNRRVVVEKDASCKACCPPVYFDAKDLAVQIYGKNEFEFLLDCKIQSGEKELEGKIFFNSKSRTKKHVTLVNEDGKWRRLATHEKALKAA